MKKLFLPILLASSLATAQASVFMYSLSFSSLGEAQPSTGIGTGSATYDNVARTLFLSTSFSGLQGNTTASHIHGATALPNVGTAGVATTTPSLVGFPLGVSSGSFATTLDLTLASSYNPSFVTANGGTPATAEVALMNAISSGRAYWNIHSTFTTSGEIRSFFTAVPEPSSLALLALGAIGVAAKARRSSRN